MPLLEGDLADLVSNADPARALLLSVNQNLSPELSKALSLIASIDDHYGKVKRAKHNLSARSALLSEKNENASQAKRLHSSFKTMQATVDKLQPELTAMEIEKAHLENKTGSSILQDWFPQSSTCRSPKFNRNHQKGAIGKVWRTPKYQDQAWAHNRDWGRQ